MNNSAANYTKLTIQFVSIALAIGLAEIVHSLSAYDDQRLIGFFKAHQALHESRYSEAKLLLSQCIAKSPDFSEAYLSRARVNERLGDYASAINDTNASITLAVNDRDTERDDVASSYLYRARLYLKAGNRNLALNDYQTAASIFSKLIKESPRQYNHYLSRASIYDILGMPEQADADRSTAQSLYTLAQSNADAGDRY